MARPSTRTEDYALIGDCQTAALVSREGSIDWLCLPRFDSGACFAALLGGPEHGHWQISPAETPKTVRRHYRDDTLVLETEFVTDTGSVSLIDFMPVRDHQLPDLVRIVRGNRGTVRMKMELVMRFDYGSIVPWVVHAEQGIVAIAGPDKVRIWSDTPLRGKALTTVSDFEVSTGKEFAFNLIWHPSHLEVTDRVDPQQALRNTEEWWMDWAAKCTSETPWREAVTRSLITLKALSFAPTGGIVAAPTTSLPEELGGVRNWDYRYCWLRDATFTLLALMDAGYMEEAGAWRQWLLRAIAGSPSEASIMYGVSGERRLPEWELDWLPGYEGSKPVRIGNAAHSQFQLDVFGELADTFYQGLRGGLELSVPAWRLQKALMRFLAANWQRPDEGIWEVRGERRHFTHSKLMAWVAFERSIRMTEEFGLKGPVAEWTQLRDRIHQDVCEKGFNTRIGAFTQFYGSEHLDASLLMMPLVGFLPADDERVRGTVRAIEQRLVTAEGFVRRYETDEKVDGLPGGEAAFLPCTFWLADCYSLQGRKQDALRVFNQLLAIRNDVGLLAEEYDPATRRFLGNFPQALSHIGLVNTAHNLARAAGPARTRSHGAPKKRHP
jgi:GH15 family glucan-1,4-alpha-glucosidase